MMTTSRNPEPIEIRPLRTHVELQACLALQRETWGDAPGTLVPTPLLLVVQRIGGVSAGAFDADDRLLGFVFGMTGVENGTLVHWSDMLAVRPEARDRGLGRLLKEHQREEVARLGVKMIYWTYDPLVAKNAYLNIAVLGARVAEYVPDMYGDTGSPVHAGIGTDRIIVAWDIASAGAGRGDAGTAVNAPADQPVRGDALRRKRGEDAVHGMVLNPAGTDFTPPRTLPVCVHIEIPADVFTVRARSADEALRWRVSTREAFQWALARGYDAQDVERDLGGDRVLYRLVRASAGAAR